MVDQVIWWVCSVEPSQSHSSRWNASQFWNTVVRCHDDDQHWLPEVHVGVQESVITHQLHPVLGHTVLPLVTTTIVMTPDQSQARLVSTNQRRVWYWSTNQKRVWYWPVLSWSPGTTASLTATIHHLLINMFYHLPDLEEVVGYQPLTLECLVSQCRMWQHEKCDLDIIIQFPTLK